MAKSLSKNDVIELTNHAFPGSFVKTQANQISQNAKPLESLAQYVVATINDLHGTECGNVANLERIAVSLDAGSQTLQQVVMNLRRQTER